MRHHRVAVRHTSLRSPATPMMPIPLRRRISEGGCPIKIAVRRPYPRPSSHGPRRSTVSSPVVFPHVIDDLLRRARATGRSCSFRCFTARNHVPGPAGAARRGQHQDPAQQVIAFLTDVPTAHPVGTRAHARREPDVAGHVFGRREAVDVPELHDQRDRDKRPHPRNRQQTLHAGIVPPPLAQVPSSRRICLSSRAAACSVANRGNRCQRRRLRLALPRREPALPLAGCRLQRASIASRRLRTSPGARRAGLGGG
jgi:hypothetical protein